MTDDQPKSFEALVDGARKRKLSRRGFIAAMTAAGATAGGGGILFAATRPAGHTPSPAGGGSSQQNVQLHESHIKRQADRPGVTPPPQGGPSGSLGADPNTSHIQAIVDDYHHDAVVEDIMHNEPIVGHEAIFARKQAEFTSIANPSIKVNNRFAYGDQVVAEWEVSGTHVGDYLGFQASNSQFTIHGITVVTRRDGKIVKESLYYDTQELARQLSAPADTRTV